jgi:hypothetical protein
VREFGLGGEACLEPVLLHVVTWSVWGSESKECYITGVLLSPIDGSSKTSFWSFRTPLEDSLNISVVEHVRCVIESHRDPAVPSFLTDASLLN